MTYLVVQPEAIVMSGEVISPSQAIRIVGCTPPALYKAMNTGRLQWLDVAGRRLLRQTDVYRYKSQFEARRRKMARPV